MLADVYYSGTRNQWNSIWIGNYDNECLTNATIHFTESNTYTVTYNYSANGGNSTTKTTADVSSGSAADLSPTAAKPGWEFVGWNTDANATTALSAYTVTGNVTLYAIFKKTLTARFYSGANSLQTTKTVTIYNNASSGTITVPTPSSYSGWTAGGWRDDTTAGSYEYGKTASIILSSDKNYYAVYYRSLSLSYNANGGTGTPPVQTATQYYNAYGSKQSKTFTLASAIEKTGYTFGNWAKGSISGAQYGAGSSISITDNTIMYAVWTPKAENTKCKITYKARINGVNKQIVSECVQGETLILPEYPFDEIPEGAAFTDYAVNGAEIKYPGERIAVNKDMVIRVNFTPQLVTQYAEDTRKVFAGYSSHNENMSLRRGFRYKKISDTLYKSVTIPLNSSFASSLTGLEPGCEYECYAFDVLSINGSEVTVNGTAVRFKVSDKTLALSDSDIYLIKSDMHADSYMLTVNIPGYEDSDIIWQSQNKKVASVKNGYVTAEGKGETYITAATRDGKYSDSCKITVGARNILPEDHLKSYDFSEWNLAMSFSVNGSGENKTGQAVERNGANALLGIAGLAGWQGVVSESADKYPTTVNETSYNSNAENIYHVQNAYILPRRKAPSDLNYVRNIKRAVVNYGAVYASFLSFSDGWNSSETSYFNSMYEEGWNGAHAIAIVGWDDNYSKNNFSTAPDGDGAFLCKNSYGENKNDNGYFYISYYDKNLCLIGDETMVFPGVGSKDNYDNIYQHDPYGPTFSIAQNDEILTANIFSGKYENETVEAVSFYTYDMATNYEIYVIPDYAGSGDLNSLGSCAAKGSFDYAGYHTVKFDTGIEITGDKFAVAVKLLKHGSEVNAYIEMPMTTGNSYINGLYSAARASEDESYIYENNAWVDLTRKYANANNCIKAFTNGSREKIMMFTAEEKDSSDEMMSLDEIISCGIKVNPAFLSYAEKGISLFSAGAADENGGLVPSPASFGDYDSNLTLGDIYPARYSLKDMGYVTPVRNQLHEYLTCWAHAIYASLESCMLRRFARTGSEMFNGGVGGEQDGAEQIADAKYTEVSGVSIDKTSHTMAAGNSLKLNAAIFPSSAVNQAVSWLSSNPGIASVDIYGNVTANASGTAVITAITDDGNKTAQCSITVTEPVGIDCITIENNSTDSLYVGEERFINFMIYPTNAEAQNIVWSSDSPDVVSVDGNGLVKGIGVGNAVVTAKTADETHSVSYEITVEDGMPVHTDTKVTAVSGMYLVTVTVDNIIDGMQIIAAGYDENNKMLSIRFFERDSMQAILPKENIAYIKTYVLAENMQPLSTAVRKYPV